MLRPRNLGENKKGSSAPSAELPPIVRLPPNLRARTRSSISVENRNRKCGKSRADDFLFVRMGTRELEEASISYAYEGTAVPVVDT
jgi:hypothetical protein